MLIGSLGNTIFACSKIYLKTFNNFNKDNSYRWIEHNIIRNKPKLQFDGVNLESIKFNIILDAIYNVNPTAAAKELKENANLGKKLKLIIGNEVLGDYVVESISEQHKRYTALGNVTKIDLSIQLKEYN